jgi:hypothetical protein
VDCNGTFSHLVVDKRLALSEGIQNAANLLGVQAVTSPTNLILCPQCQYTFPNVSGSRAACPRCGKIIVSTMPSEIQESGVAFEPKKRTTPIQPAGDATLPVVCKFCGTRYFGKPAAIGKLIPCPDCHTDNLVVPVPQMVPKANPPTPTPQSNNSGDDDDLKLSAPVEPNVARMYTTESQHLEKMLRQNNSLPAAGSETANMRVHSQTEVKSATAPAKPAPRYNVDWNQLNETPETATNKSTHNQQQHFWNSSAPLKMSSIFVVLQTAVFTRWISLALLATFQIIIAYNMWQNLWHPDTTEQLFGMIMAIALCFSFIPAILGTASFSLAVFENTANGDHEIKHWSEFNFMDWAFTAFFLVSALTMSGAPGAMIGLACYGVFEMSDTAVLVITTTLVGSSLYFCFPFIFISMQEAGSIYEPFSTSMIKNFAPLRSSWMKFYSITLMLIIATTILIAVFTFIGLLCVDKSAKVPPMLGLIGVIPTALIATAFPLIYFRYLGQIALIYRDYVLAQEELAERELQ